MKGFLLEDDQIKIVTFALEHLHDSILDDFGERNIKVLESAMDEFGIKYESRVERC